MSAKQPPQESTHIYDNETKEEKEDRVEEEEEEPTGSWLSKHITTILIGCAIAVAVALAVFAYYYLFPKNNKTNTNRKTFTNNYERLEALNNHSNTTYPVPNRKHTFQSTFER